jgi:hypothetical protein
MKEIECKKEFREESEKEELATAAVMWKKKKILCVLMKNLFASQLRSLKMIKISRRE